MGGKPLNADMYEKIVTDRLVFGVPSTTIATSIDRSKSSVDAVVAAFEAVRDQNWVEAGNVLVRYKISLDPFYWAAKKIGVDIPPELEQVYEKRKEEARALQAVRRANKVKPPVITPEPIPVPPPAVEPKKEDNTALYLLKLLEAVNKQNELLEQLYDVVLPKWVGDMKDNVNCNSDVLSQSLKRIEDKLEAIKINVRKRGL